MLNIAHNGLLLATIGHVKDMPQGKVFHIDKDYPLQFGTFFLPLGAILEPHIHKVRERHFNTKTIEFFYVVSGVMKATFYGLDKQKVSCQILKQGNWVMMFDGGHGFKILRKDTKFMEVKLGPFGTVEADKQRIISE